MAQNTSTRVRKVSPAAQQSLYAGLARMLSSGIPADRALQTLAQSGKGPVEAAIKSAGKGIAGGTALVLALRNAGLVPAADRSLLENAEQAGRLDAALDVCARRLQVRIEQARRLRTRLIAPAAILVAACVLSPLPALVAGRIDLGGYALRALGPLLIIVLLIMLVRTLLPQVGGALLESLPVVGGIVRRRRLLDTLESLQLHLTSGTPAIDALQDLSHSAPAGVARKGATIAHERVLAGISIADALEAGGFLNRREGLPIISAGEQAGRLDTALTRYLKTLREAQSSREDTLAQWIPRGIYFAAAAFAAWTMLG